MSFYKVDTMSQVGNVLVDMNNTLDAFENVPSISESQFKFLEKKEAQLETLKDDNMKCPVCFECYDNDKNQACVFDVCNHMTCYKCFVNLISQRRMNCPTCAKSIHYHSYKDGMSWVIRQTKDTNARIKRLKEKRFDHFEDVGKNEKLLPALVKPPPPPYSKYPVSSSQLSTMEESIMNGSLVANFDEFNDSAEAPPPPLLKFKHRNDRNGKRVEEQTTNTLITQWLRKKLNLKNVENFHLHKIPATNIIVALPMV